MTNEELQLCATIASTSSEEISRMSHEELKVFTLKLLTAFRKTSKYVPQPRPNLSTVALVFNDGTAELARREEKRRRLTEEGLILGEAS